jgi:hypothetical protein
MEKKWYVIFRGKYGRLSTTATRAFGVREAIRRAAAEYGRLNMMKDYQAEDLIVEVGVFPDGSRNWKE